MAFNLLQKLEKISKENLGYIMKENDNTFVIEKALDYRRDIISQTFGYVTLKSLIRGIKSRGLNITENYSSFIISFNPSDSSSYNVKLPQHATLIKGKYKKCLGFITGDNFKYEYMTVAELSKLDVDSLIKISSQRSILAVNSMKGHYLGQITVLDYHCRRLATENEQLKLELNRILSGRDPTPPAVLPSITQ